MPRQSRTKQQLKSQVAAVAARIMAEDGVVDYATAKRKAARQLGMDDLHVLPDNDQVDEALRIHQALYQADEQPARIRRLREAALRAMQILAAYRPYLQGRVLRGNAGRHDYIDLQLFTDDVKEVELFLLNRRIPFEIAPARGPAVAEAPVYVLDWEGEILRLAVHPLNDERAGPPGGRHHERATAAAVQAMLEANS